MKAFFVFAALTVLVIVGCSSSSSTPTAADASTQDAADIPCTEPSTTPAGSCKPSKCSTGNAKHIGAFCTKGGGECDKYSLLCAIDLDPRGEAFCVKLGCQGNADCGDHGCCYQNQVCLPAECGCGPSGADGGADASSDAASDAPADG